jgi:predicted metal-dependent hydrolase
MIHKKAKIQYGTTTIPYHIIKSKRIKTSEIIVDSDKVTIRTPLNKSLSDIHNIISGKAAWILKNQKEYKETIPQIIKPTVPSMTKEGSINLNVNLLKAPEDVIDYIILHEICHLKIKEHRGIK